MFFLFTNFLPGRFLQGGCVYVNKETVILASRRIMADTDFFYKIIKNRRDS